MKCSYLGGGLGSMAKIGNFVMAVLFFFITGKERCARRNGMKRIDEAEC